MARLAVRAHLRRAGTATVLAFVLLCATPVSRLPASADPVAYLVNVTVRPGYHFNNADEALTYGYGLCNQVAEGRSYAALISQMKTDFATSDEFQASYLITHAVNELCPASIWKLRNSAAHYRLPPP